MIEILKAVLFGIVEGVTEWLPVSSTGHIILLDEFIRLNASEEFKSMFDVVIQLGAILAVIVLFFHKLNPFALSKSKDEKKQTLEKIWFRNNIISGAVLVGDTSRMAEMIDAIKYKKCFKDVF